MAPRTGKTATMMAMAPTTAMAAMAGMATPAKANAKTSMPMVITAPISATKTTKTLPPTTMLSTTTAPARAKADLDRGER